jgi:hypothetical protein
VEPDIPGDGRFWSMLWTVEGVGERREKCVCELTAVAEL